LAERGCSVVIWSDRMIINPEQVISAITGVANPLIKEKIQRNETVIKLLQQFKLDPEHPPADFSGVYAYTLVEYGVGKPKPCLELFRQEEIKLAFRKAFDHNNPSILLSEVDACIDACDFGDEIKYLRIDIRREIAAFYIVFSEVAKRSRNPADTLMSQQIGSVHKQIANIQEQLDRLPTLEGIRTEIARLAAQNYPALPGVEASVENRCRAIALAQQMRGWFDTLGYRLEKYEVWGNSFFEWIINVPARRNRYDRILFRGVEGEVGLKDVAILRNSVDQQRTDEGWLVTARRISRAARDELEKEENRHLACYTFDELIDQDADFSDYLDWLEAEIKRRKIDTKYVPLACTKEEFDPDSKQRIGVSRYEEQDGWIDGYIDMWLDDPAKEHISILGEFGTGKTWFAFHYASVALQRYKDAQRRGVERPRLPLVITLRDFAKALNVENVLAGFFFTQHDIRINSSVFEQLNRMGKLLLIFDGFDEMAAKVDRQQMINNFWELAKVVVPGAKVILTCRTEHFPEAQEGRALLNAELQASTKLLTGETPQFEVLELEKFNDDQIRQVLSHQATASTVEQVMSNPQLLDLARRPVMTELILEALPDIELGKPVDMSRVYLYAVRRKMERDIKSDRTFTSLADKLYFLCELSWEMLSTDQMSFNYRLFPDRIRRLFGSIVQEQKDLDHWHYDMMGQTMLIRNGSGDYTPAHRSLLEFFVAYKFAAELGVLAEDFTKLTIEQSHINDDAPQEYTWSSYFSRNVDLYGNVLSSVPISEFVSEPLEKLRDTFGLKPLTKAVMDLLVPMVDVDKKEVIIKVIEETRGKSEDEVSYVGGNAATLLLKKNEDAFEMLNFSNTVIKNADFSNARLVGTNFTKANLSGSTFTKILSKVISVAISPNNKLLAIGDFNGSVCLWDTATGKEVLVLQGHYNFVASVVFNDSGTMLATGSNDGTIKLWDVKTGDCLKTFKGHTNKINSVAFNPGGEIIASGSYDQTIKLWDVESTVCLKTLLDHTEQVRSVAFSPNGQILASGCGDATIKLWDVKSGQCLKTLLGHSSRVYSVAFSPDGEILASGSNDQTIKLWSTNDGLCIKTLQEHTDRVTSVMFKHDGQALISSSHDRTVKLWNINTGKCFKSLNGHTDNVYSAVFSSDGRIAASGSRDFTARLWHVDSGECFMTLYGYTDQLRTIFSPDGQIVAIASDRKVIKLWDYTTGKYLRILKGHSSWVGSVVFSPDGKLLASGSGDKTVRIWETSSGRLITILQGHTSRIHSIAFSPDGNSIASSSGDNTIRIWNVSNGECLNVLQGHSSKVLSVAFSPENSFLLASSSADCTIKLWNLYTGECFKTLEGHTNFIYSLSFSFDGQILASGSDDKTVKLWNLSSNNDPITLHGHSNWVPSVAFSPFESLLATGSADGVIKLWDSTTGECISTFNGDNYLASVSFSPDGQIIVSSGKNVQFWYVKTGKCFKTITDRPYENMNIAGVKGLTDAEIATLKALGAVDNE
jgi:predicted NACHT family NTPase